MHLDIRHLILLSCLLVTQAITPSCNHLENSELRMARRQLSALKKRQNLYNYAPNSYDYFVSHNQYPATINIYKDEELLRLAQKNCCIVICLAQQRGRLYVNGQIAADWPVSTGIQGRATPTGNFSIREKRESYASNRYGKILDKDGKCVNGDADAFSDSVSAWAIYRLAHAVLDATYRRWGWDAHRQGARWTSPFTWLYSHSQRNGSRTLPPHICRH